MWVGIYIFYENNICQLLLNYKSIDIWYKFKQNCFDYNLGTDKTYFIKTNVLNYLKNNESESIN